MQHRWSSYKYFLSSSTAAGNCSDTLKAVGFDARLNPCSIYRIFFPFSSSSSPCHVYTWHGLRLGGPTWWIRTYFKAISNSLLIAFGTSLIRFSFGSLLNMWIIRLSWIERLFKSITFLSFSYTLLYTSWMPWSDRKM